MKKSTWIILLALAVLIVLRIAVKTSMFVVTEGQSAIVTQFGGVVGKPILKPGLYFKSPFVQEANFLEQRVIEWDGDPNQVPTKDKLFIHVDTYARWRISDPLVFFQRSSPPRRAKRPNAPR